MPNTARPLPRTITVEEFLRTDQAEFGSAWQYELVDGVPVAQASPSPDHGAIAVNIAALLRSDLATSRCRAETGTAAIPRDKSETTARRPDVMVRCDGTPIILFEVVSPADDHDRKAKAARYRDLKNVTGVKEIVEVEQSEFLCRIHRWRDEIGGWQIEEISGPSETLRLISLGVELVLPLDQIYHKVLPLS